MKTHENHLNLIRIKKSGWARENTFYSDVRVENELFLDS